MIDRSATALLDGMRSKAFSAQELMRETLNRIDAVNPTLNAIVALHDADALLAEAADPRPGPLSGLPIAIKDLADTTGITTTYGSPLFKAHVPDKDSAMVRRIKSAGAIVIGKTNTPEWGLGSNTYNPVYGITRNPFDPARSAGGSSGGAAVALAARMVSIADGSDMMGSLRNPAGWNNVYGFRPSYGLVANDGPGEVFLNQLSTGGPMARTLEDLELLLQVISEHDPKHPHSSGPYDPGDSVPPQRIGWLGDWGGAYPIEEGVLENCEAGLALLEDLGHVIIPLPPPFSADALWQAWTSLRSWAAAGRLGPLFDNPETRNGLKPEAVWEIERGRTLTGEELRKAALIQSNWFRTTATMEVDMLALPSAQLFPFPADWEWPKQVAGRQMDSYHRWMEVVVPASLTGLPALCVPTGFGKSGLPMGLQLIGHRGADARVLALGRAYNDAEPWSATAPELP